MRRKPRKWDDHHHDDPGAGLLNLFDVWIAFAAALLLAALSYGKMSSKTAAGTGADAIDRNHLPMNRYRMGLQQTGGEGQRLGVAYRLKTGEIIYVPEKK